MLPVLSYVSCMWDVSYVTSPRCGSGAWEWWLWRQKISLHPHKREWQQCREQRCSLPTALLLVSEKVFTVPWCILWQLLLLKCCLVSLCPTSAGAHNMLRLELGIMWLHREGGQGHHVDLTLTLEGQHLCGSKDGLFLNESCEAPGVLPVCSHSEPLYSNLCLHVSALSVCIS